MIWPLRLLTVVVVAIIYRSTMPESKLDKENFCIHGSCTWISAAENDFNTSHGPLLMNEQQGWVYGILNDMYWTPQNALWKDGSNGVTNGQHYWVIQILKFKGPGLYVGVTTPKLFQPGWSLRGFLFGQGRRKNGYHHLEDIYLEPIYGPILKAGDSVGIFLDLSGSRVKVYFDINDESLGLAFDVPREKFVSMDDGQDSLPEYYPVAQFFNEGVVKIKKVSGWPLSLKRTWIKPYDGITGPWEYLFGCIDPSSSPTTKATLNISVRDANVTVGELDIWNTNIIRWTKDTKGSPYFKEWKGEEVDIILLGNGHTPDFEREMVQFLTTDKLTWDMPQKDSLIIKDTRLGKTTSWKRPALEPIEMKPVNYLGRDWPIQ